MREERDAQLRRSIGEAQEQRRQERAQQRREDDEEFRDLSEEELTEVIEADEVERESLG